jgi:hypothetical protein
MPCNISLQKHGPICAILEVDRGLAAQVYCYVAVRCDALPLWSLVREYFALDSTQSPRSTLTRDGE